jgi:transposase
LYRRWAGRVDLVMRHHHRAGDKLFIDYAGHTIPIYPPGEPSWEAELFVAVLGASNFTFAEASASQQSSCWLGSHVRCLEAMGAVPALLVPDNLRSGVSQAHRYEPLLNRSYQEMASHYGTAIMPARAGKPRDKAKVEVAVLDRRALAVGQPAQRAVHQLDRGQRRHRPETGLVEQPAVRQTGRYPPKLVRAAGPPSDAPAPGHSV